MLFVLFAIMIVTIISIVITILVFFESKEKREENATLCGILWAMFSVLITIIITILCYQSDDIHVKLKDGRGIEKENGTEIIVDKDNLKLHNEEFYDTSWYISLCNLGNKSSNNIKVKIEFDNIIFENEIDNYVMGQYRHGLGGYTSLTYNVQDMILPDDCIDLPMIDFSNAYLDEDIDKDIMTVNVYTENNKLIKKNYSISLKK